MLKAAALAAALSFVSSASFAATYVVPPDRDLIRQAPAIVVATAISSETRVGAESGIETVTSFRVEERIKGPVVGDTLDVFEPGGTYGGVTKVIAGTPVFAPGERVLLMLRERPDGEWAVLNLGLGKFRFTHDTLDRTLLVREDVTGWDSQLQTYDDPYRSAERFLSFVRDEVRGAHPEPNYVVAHVALKPVTNSTHAQSVTAFAFTAASYTYGGRRPGFASTVTYGRGLTAEAGAPSGGDTAINAAMNAWNGVSGTTIKLAYSGATRTDTGLQPSTGDGKNTVQFERDLSWKGVPPFTCTASSYNGVLGLGGFFSTGNHSGPNNETFETITEGDVEMNQGIANCTLLFGNGDFNTAVAHEVGHSIGFRHADQDPFGGACNASVDCASSAIMKSFIPSGIHAAPQAWDIRAAQAVYPGAVVCTPPSISSVTGTATITAGNSTVLTVSASGTATLSYQWYTGASGNTASPVAGGTTAQISVSPANTTTYWVRVTGQCAPVADSATVTVTVNPAVCVGAGISTQPGSPTITSGQTTSLSVVASGSAPFTYQWYIGASPSTTTPTGSNSSSLTVSPTTNTQYWVRVTNSCGSANSNTATVTVNAPVCNPPNISGQPQDQSVVSGNSAILSIGFSGTQAIATWYKGAPPDKTQQIGVGANVSTGPITTSSTYYAIVSNACGTLTSRIVTITVSQTCTAPAVTSVSATPATITSGQSSAVTVVATGTSLSYQWFVGTSGDTSNPVSGGNTSTIGVGPTQTTNYWVRVSSGCGAAPANSATVTVTVATCAPAALLGPINGTTTVAPGATTTLSISAAGTETLHYQWYQGPNGDTSKPVGTDAASFTTPVGVVNNTQFWVRVSNTCGAADAAAVSVLVKAGRQRVARH
jgi:hypothetical protein